MNRNPKRLITLTLIGLLSLVAVAQTYQPGTPMSDPTCLRTKDSFDCLPIAPDSERVDLTQPSFSNSTTITNPLYPVSNLHSVVMLGHVDGKPFRSETTLLPGTRVIEWNGQKIETLLSQYVAYSDGRIEEVALDWYAQADDGSVWYLGEDVADFADGVMFTNDGTWLAGREGPAALIMPANPQVGNVYRAENLPYFVFEEMTVKRIGQTINGPRGPISGAMTSSELNGSGDISYKILAPGYGEFRTGNGIDNESLALAVPTDALSGPVPTELQALSTAATDLFNAAQSEDWAAASATLATMSTAWNSYRVGDVPDVLETELGNALVAVIGAVDAQNSGEALQAAINLARASLDLELQYRPVAEIDLARFDLLTRQILVDAAAENAGGVTSDVTTLELVWDRISHAVAAASAEQIVTHLESLRSAADSADLSAASDVATQLHDFLTAVKPTS
jgi:hypothetical protein